MNERHLKQILLASLSSTLLRSFHLCCLALLGSGARGPPLPLLSDLLLSTSSFILAVAFCEGTPVQGWVGKNLS